MIACKPKMSTYFSLGVVVALLVAGLIYILNDFANRQSYGLWFYLISCSLITVVLLILLVKMMANYRFITVKRNSLEIRIPLKGLQRNYPLSSVKAWQEEIIMANKKDLDPHLLRSMFNAIRSAEIKNIKTQIKDDKGMVRVIEDYVSKKVREEMNNNED